MSALDRAVNKMIEVAKQEQRCRQVEVELVEGKPKTARKELRLAQEYGEGMEQSHDKALDD